MPRKQPKAPKFIEQLENIQVNVGKTAVIDCVCEGEPEPDCDWFFNGKIVKDEGRFRYLFEKDDVVGLEIKRVTVEDEGEYKCVAFNKSGEVESKCEILVNAAGKIVDAPKNQSYEENDTAIFKCKYDGYPHPQVKWFREKKEIKNGGKYLIENKNQIASVEIDELTIDDGGSYSVVVSNESGEDEVSFVMTVHPDKKKPAKKEAVKPMTNVTNFQKQAAGRIFTPPGRKSKKKKLPIEREGIIPENPELYYKFGEEIGKGKFSVVKKVVNKKTGLNYAAKIIKFDGDSLKFAIREYDLMASGKTATKGTVKLHEAYLVRKYLILIMDLIDGKTLLDQVAHRHSLNEEDVSQIIRQLCETLCELHSRNIVHLDIRPTNIRFATGREVKLLDYNSARHIFNKKAGEVVDVIGDTEFCAPEMLRFEPVLPGSDMWSIGVITYTMLSGISPFFYEDENKVVLSVQDVKWKFDEDAFANVSSNAKDFIKRLFVRIPEQRLTAAAALEHPWFDKKYEAQRKNSVITHALEDILATDERLYSEEEEDYVEASLVFRTFDEEEYESPVESDDDDEDEEEE